MARSAAYWDIAEAVKSEAAAVAKLAADAHDILQHEDDPGILADDLVAVMKGAEALAKTILPAIAPLRATAKALESVPTIKEQIS